MKLWQKGTAALLLLSMILLQSVAFASDNTVLMQRKIERLVAFDILSGTETIDQSPISRGEMAELVVRATNNVVGVGKGMSYEDVPASHPKSGAIETANSLGYVRETDDNLFYPDRQVTKQEALVMICTAMGYADIALSLGGYPTGYEKLAIDQNITKGITNNKLTKKDAILMISNMLDAGAVTHVYRENDPSLVISSKVTYLEEAFKVDKYKVELKEVDTAKRRVAAKFINGDLEGEVREVAVSSKVNLHVIGTKATIYMDREDYEFAVFLETRGAGPAIVEKDDDDDDDDDVEQVVQSGVICDFISETNRSEAELELTISDLDSVTFTNADYTYKIAEDAIITYADEILTTEAYKYVGTFCKAVVRDGIVERMDVYPLTEGGIIYRADEDELRFSVGTEYENYWQGFSNAPDLQIYIDGKSTNKLQDLKSNMVFDYWYGGGQKFVIVASSRVAKGILTEIDTEYMVVGGAEYILSEPYGWYTFSAEELGFIPGDMEDVYGMEVTAYLDDNQRVRYVIPEIGKDKNAPFKGFVIRTYGEADSEERSIKIHRVDGVGVETYPVKDKLKKSGLTFEYVQSVQSNLDALGFLEFTLDENGEISKIEKIENFGKDVRTHTGYFADSYHTIGGLYADEATIYALMEIDGAFTVKHIGYNNELSWTQPGPDGVKVISDFDLKENPIPDYIVLGRGSETICDSITQFDIIESVKWTGEEDIYNIKFLGGDTFDVDKAFIDKYDLKKNCMVKYGEKNLGKFRINVGEVIDLSGNAEDWEVDTYETGKNRGFFRANSIVERNHDAIQFVANGITTDLYLYRNDNTAGYYAMKIYEYLGKGKIQKARDTAAVGTNIAWYIRPVLKYPVMNIQKGDDVWFHLHDDGSGMMTIDYMLYKSNNRFFE